MIRFARRALGISTALILALVVLGVSIVQTISALNAEPELLGTANLTPSPTPAKINYYLPYPGMLPDHFLYPVKMARDRVMLILTFDEKKKADTYLMYADKRLNATKFLVEGNKVALGVTTASKAGKYLEQAYNTATNINNANSEETDEFWMTLATAASKHEEVLNELTGRIDVNLMPEWEKALDYARMVKDKANQELREE